MPLETRDEFADANVLRPRVRPEPTWPDHQRQGRGTEEGHVLAIAQESHSLSGLGIKGKTVGTDMSRALKEEETTVHRPGAHLWCARQMAVTWSQVCLRTDGKY